LRRIHYFEAVTSTQEEAAKLAQEGAPHGDVVLAEWQSGGKGRRGKAWHCPRGRGILASAIVRGAVGASETPLLSLATALAVAEAIGTTTGLEVRTKWPNDVLIGGRKVAGILVEALPSVLGQGSGGCAIVGIGVNVNFRREELVRESGGLVGERESGRITTIVEELGREVDRLTILGQIMGRMEEYYTLLAGGEGGRIVAAWLKADAFLGERVEVQMGEEVVQGVYEEVAEDGSLILLTGGGERRRLSAGEMRRVVGCQ
jgi:BirA family biotin operon repressor/biotin-[acetyl-CoA-carboxylase] ligase